MAQLKSFAKSLTTTGIFVLIIGITAILFPYAFGKATVIILGIIFIIGGVLRLSFAIFSLHTGSMLFKYLAGILMILAGIWMIANPEIGLDILTILLAVYFILDGISSIAYSSTMIPITGGAYLIAEGIISIIIGILIWSHWPESGKFVLSVYIGIKLLFSGMAIMMTGKLLKNNE